MKQCYLILIALLFFNLANTKVLAQPKSASGTVADLRGNPLPGVNVTVKSTSSGTVTDLRGRYVISVPEGFNTVVFSFVGFVTREVEIGNQTVVDVTLVEDIKHLDEVVVTALNIERNTKALASSVTQIDGDNFTQARENSTPNALAGRVAGVNVTKIASGPAGSSRVVIRGAKSLGFGGNFNQPLYVVDGIPVDNYNMGQSGVWGGPDWGDTMSSFNPDDIQSITVLKGAASAALYGSRAATGVVLITTKKGAGSKGIGIEYNGNFVFEMVNNLTDWQHSYGSGGMVGPSLATQVATKPMDQNEGFDNYWYDQAWGPKFDEDSTVQFDGQIRPYAYTGDNWSRFYQTGTSVTNSLSFTGGSETQNFRASIAKLSNTGVIPNSGFDRLNLTIGTNSKFGEKFSFVAKMMFSNEKVKNRPMISDSPGNAIQSIYKIPGDQNVYNYKGDPNKLGAVPEGMTTPDEKSPGEELQATANLWGQNPYWAAYQFVNSDKRDRIIASGQLRYDLTDFLYLQVKGGMDLYTMRTTSLTPQGTGYQRGGSINEIQTSNSEVNLEYVTGFNKTFGKINVNAFFGGNQMRRHFERFWLAGNGFNVPYHAAINNAVSKTSTYGYEGVMINSLFASAEIAYNNYFFITATARKDWFSTLQPENNSILYPSVGASFVFSDALAALPRWLSFGKVRLSWAQVGDASSVRPANTQLTYTLGPTHLTKPMAYFSSYSNLPNSALRPYRSEEVEFGFDVRFFENRVGLDLTYYSQATKDDILDADVSWASGFWTSSVNLGKLTNNGVEVLLTGTPANGALSWNVSLNFAWNNSKVVSLLPGQNELNVEEPRTRTVYIKHMVGHPYGMITGLKQQRDSLGQLIFNQDGMPVTSGEYEILGNGVPKFTGGLNNSLTYKQFNLAFLIDFKAGGQIYSGTNALMTMYGFHKQTLAGREGEAQLKLTGAVKTTDAEGNVSYPDFATYRADPSTDGYYNGRNENLTPGEAGLYWGVFSQVANDHFVYDASFIKLRQLTFGYSFSRKMLSKSPFKTLTLSFVGRNLAILYKNVENIDPESSYTSSNAQGLDYFGMPPTRSYGFNLNATF